MVFELAWGRNGTPETLSGSADTVTISDQTSTKFNQILSQSFGSGGAVQWKTRFGNTTIDTGANYASRYEINGGTDATEVSQNEIYMLNSGAGVAAFMHIGHVINISSEEKLLILFCAWAGNAGAGNAPERNCIVAKWVNTSNQFDNIQLVNVNTGDYTTDSNISAIGTD